MVIRVRAKISFMALTKRMTIVELVVSTIMRVYYELESEGFYPQFTPE